MSFTHKHAVLIGFPRLSCSTVYILFAIAFLIVNQRPNCTLKSHEKINPSKDLVINYSRTTTTMDPESGAVLNCEDLKKSVMKTGYSISECRGRLGNQLGMMALGLQVHLRFGTRLLVQPLQYTKLVNVFDMEQICKSDASSFCIVLPKGCRLTARKKDTIYFKREQLWKKGISLYGKYPSALKGKRVQLNDFPQFLPWLVEILSEFRKRMKIHERVVSAATEIVNKTREAYNCTDVSFCVLVVVHMRIEDYTEFLEGKPDLMADTDYIPNSFNYTEKHHPNPLFLVVGNTPNNISDYFSRHEQEFQQYRIEQTWRLQENAGLSTDMGIGVDFVILSLADVVILTYGSFGDFGALFGTNRLPVYYPIKHPSHDETGVNKGLPGFKGLPWTILNKKF
ncbi:uncharacterized protein LOC142342701 isoform X1 [Convolutriloba macropyga]|uniref:uncharacterized protein LOC142342701 isoform X1 n=2 Tax=Convolutriloba macropyga TaxID=536237 RepID=UPI003F51C9D5